MFNAWWNSIKDKWKKWSEYPDLPEVTVKASFTKIQLPATRRVFPSLITNQVISYQPMKIPINLLFLDYVYRMIKFPFNLDITKIEPGTLIADYEGKAMIFVGSDRLLRDIEPTDTVIYTLFDVARECEVKETVAIHWPPFYTQHEYFAIPYKLFDGNEGENA